MAIQRMRNRRKQPCNNYQDRGQISNSQTDPLARVSCSSARLNKAECRFTAASISSFFLSWFRLHSCWILARTPCRLLLANFTPKLLSETHGSAVLGQAAELR